MIKPHSSPLAPRRRFGWVPDLPDQRDWVYGRFSTRSKKSVDLRPNLPPVENQGQLGSCTGNALASAIEYLEIKDNIKSFEDVSRLFIYYNERLLEGTVNQDAGASIRDGIKSLIRWGVCSEKLWPYNISRFKQKPPVKCYKDAANHTLQAYYRIRSLEDMKDCLSHSFPFVFGFVVYDSFLSDQVARTGIVPMPGPGETVQGGHAVLAVGYDMSIKRMIVRNSWGSSWGDEGYFYLPFSYIGNSILAWDMWFIIRQKDY